MHERRSSSSKGHDRRQRQQHPQQLDTDDSNDGALPNTHVITLGGRISHLQLQLARSQEQLNTQQQQAAAQISTLQQDKSQLSNRLRALHRQQASDKLQAKRREQELQAQLSQLQAIQRPEQQWTELQGDVDACKLAVKAAKEELQRKLRMLVAAQQEQQRLDTRIKQLEEELAEKDKKASKWHRQCKATEATASELQEEVTQLKASQGQAKEAAERVRVEVEQLRDSLSRSQLQVADLHEAVMQRELMMASLGREKSEADKQLGESRVLCDRQMDELQMWRKKEQETQSTLAHTVHQLEEVNQQLSACQAGRSQSHLI